MTRVLTAATDPRLLKGRGARSNDSSRYDSERRVGFDDGWVQDDEPPPPIKTEVHRDATRTIIARNTSPDISFNQSINPYRGCEHGCVYCFARPTHAYLGYSPGIDFESKLLVKPDAAKLLEAELRKPSYQPQEIAMGTNTDPYQPIEREWRVTRSILQVLAEFKNPIAIVTKSALITRDIKLSRIMEPGSATPERRLDTLRSLSSAGIPTGVMTAPIIPALNDEEMESILAAAAEAGIVQAG